MMQSSFTPLVTASRTPGRRIVQVTAGRTHGAITRLMSPGDLGELVKPFVFLDYFEAPSSGGPRMADHPHSGIATHTTLLQGSVGYRDSTGKSGILHAGSIEWMQAGGGVWHGGDMRVGEPIRGYQLWVALPASLELQPAFSQYLDPGASEPDGPVRVLLGSHGKRRSAIADVSPIVYLHVRLKDGESWRYEAPRDHSVAWLAVNEGRLHVSGAVVARQMAVFEEGDETVEVRADGVCDRVCGQAPVSTRMRVLLGAHERARADPRGARHPQGRGGCARGVVPRAERGVSSGSVKLASSPQ